MEQPMRMESHIILRVKIILNLNILLGFFFHLACDELSFELICLKERYYIYREFDCKFDCN